jgi:hypothetical protein
MAFAASLLLSEAQPRAKIPFPADFPTYFEEILRDIAITTNSARRRLSFRCDTPFDGNGESDDAASL